MSVTGRTLLTKIDWPLLSANLSKRPEIVKALQEFNKKFTETDRDLSALNAQKTEIDFEYYRSVLKNTEVVDKLQKKYAAFKPVKLEISEQLKAIEQLEKSASTSAKDYSVDLQNRLAGLKETIGNIQAARPVDELTTIDVCQARPETMTEVEEMVKKGEYTVPGYDSKFPSLGF
ncbi:ATP synthase subunit d, mitochondrial [Zancudomyces culisetae]|uniref:ATP synthase subunit d, mitochondrial n=1 Tax=Zancudomyces culisetae TaxID=1213189 RepID=A0A1R1PBU2_ZANCU|nr:ATP synthase subunit d, mitochondrial [Zancudomyces culisetae]|eukprot:OMH78436.1 ATP synthase subunit d, mitochondrial [Zancudomyces culisetae]